VWAEAIRRCSEPEQADERARSARLAARPPIVAASREEQGASFLRWFPPLHSLDGSSMRAQSWMALIKVVLDGEDLDEDGLNLTMIADVTLMPYPPLGPLKIPREMPRPKRDLTEDEVTMAKGQLPAFEGALLPLYGVARDTNILGHSLNALRAAVAAGAALAVAPKKAHAVLASLIGIGKPKRLTADHSIADLFRRLVHAYLTSESLTAVARTLDTRCLPDMVSGLAADGAWRSREFTADKRMAVATWRAWHACSQNDDWGNASHVLALLAACIEAENMSRALTDCACSLEQMGKRHWARAKREGKLSAVLRAVAMPRLRRVIEQLWEDVASGETLSVNTEQSASDAPEEPAILNEPLLHHLPDILSLEPMPADDAFLIPGGAHV